MIFRNRRHAGELLARAILERFDGNLINPVVVAIPRGGVVVAEPVAEVLKAPIELVIPRKIGAPFNEEFAVGAVTEDGYVLLNPSVPFEALGITKDYIERKAREEIEEIERRREKYLSGFKRVPLKGRDVILVDDGIATGLTVKAAISSLKRQSPNRIILAVPVMPADRVPEFRDLVDDLIVLYAPEFFQAVGQFYQNFSQTTDEEVIEILRRNREMAGE